MYGLYSVRIGSAGMSAEDDVRILFSVLRVGGVVISVLCVFCGTGISFIKVQIYEKFFFYDKKCIFFIDLGVDVWHGGGIGVAPM